MIGYTIRHRVRFMKYSFFGVLAFGVDLTLLYLLNTVAEISYISAVPFSFVTATSLHYAMLRSLVFRDSERHAGAGYGYFLIIMCANATLITFLVSGLIEFFGVPLYPARIVIGASFGLVSFFLNSRYNFKIL